jgi:RecA-family ATPase
MSKADERDANKILQKEGEEALRKAFDKAKRITDNVVPLPGAAPITPDAELSLPPPLTYEQWSGRELGEPDFISGSWLSTTSRALLIAPTGIGKTTFVMQLGYNISIGKVFLHWLGRRPRRVLYIDGEMARRLLRKKVIECKQRAGEVSTTFFALSHEDIEDFKPLNTKDGQACIDRLIGKIGGVDLIIFDSVMCLLAGSMREEEPWAQTLPWIRLLTKRNIGQIWVHHTGHDETRSYGDKTREWQLDTVVFLTPDKQATADISFALEFRKARERTPETRDDFRDVKIALGKDEWTYDGAPIAKSEQITPTAKRFLDALNNVLASGDCNETRKIGGRLAASTNAWQAECTNLGLIDTKAKPDSARSMFSKYRRELVSKYRVGCEGDWSWPVT